MTEQELQSLGFEKQTTEEGWYYYTCTVTRGFEFITNASDEIKDGNWEVEFFESQPTIRFTEPDDLRHLINLITNNIVK